MGGNASLESSRKNSGRFTDPWLFGTLLCGSLSSRHYYQVWVLWCVCGGKGNVKTLCWALLLTFPGPQCCREACRMGLRAPDWQWLTAEVAGWLQCKSNFSCFISASWVLSCNGEAGVIYWVNLHFSDVARATVMSESQLRWRALLLLLTCVTPSLPPAWWSQHEGCTVCVPCRGHASLSSSHRLSPLSGRQVGVPCVTTLCRAVGLQSFRIPCSCRKRHKELILPASPFSHSYGLTAKLTCLAFWMRFLVFIANAF